MKKSPNMSRADYYGAEIDKYTERLLESIYPPSRGPARHSRDRSLENQGRIERKTPSNPSGLWTKRRKDTTQNARIRRPTRIDGIADRDGSGLFPAVRE